MYHHQDGGELKVNNKPNRKREGEIGATLETKAGYSRDIQQANKGRRARDRERREMGQQ
jgi:hypothetical protein